MRTTPIIAGLLVPALATVAVANPGANIDLVGFASGGVGCGHDLAFTATVASALDLEGTIVLNGTSTPFKATKTAKTLSIAAGKLDCAKALSFTATATGAGGKQLAKKTFAPAVFDFTPVTASIGGAALVIATTSNGCGKPLAGFASVEGKTAISLDLSFGDEKKTIALPGAGTKIEWVSGFKVDCTKPVPPISFSSTSKAGVANGTLSLSSVKF